MRQLPSGSLRLAVPQRASRLRRDAAARPRARPRPARRPRRASWTPGRTPLGRRWPSARQRMLCRRASGGGHSSSVLESSCMPTIERNRSAERIERDIETLAGSDYTLSDEAIRRYAYTDVYRRTLDWFTRELEATRVHGRRGSARNARGAEPAARRAGLRRRLALRLQPERRQVRRHDGRRHGARGLPPERGARPRAAAAARLVPRGGGLRLRADAPRQPDHRAAGHRGGAEGDVPRDRRRPQLLGARRGGRVRARALARVQPRARRPHRLDRDAHRAGARAPGHGQPDRDRERDRRLHPRRRAT